MSNEHPDVVHQFSMADVSAKKVTRRRALAHGLIHVGAPAFELLKDRKLPKGDALALAEMAGLQGAKLTPALLPLCHPISLDRVTLHSVLHDQTHAAEVFCLAEISERTGVEMEALCGVAVALLTIWDLAKPVNPALRISDVELLFKSGGKRGEWTHPGGLSAAAKAILKQG